MYKVIDQVPDNFDVRRHGEPLIVLGDEYGGLSVIVEDDSCLVLMNGSSDREFQSVKHWYREAVLALVELMHKRAMESVQEEYKPWRSKEESLT